MRPSSSLTLGADHRALHCCLEHARSPFSLSLGPRGQPPWWCPRRVRRSCRCRQPRNQFSLLSASPRSTSARPRWSCVPGYRVSRAGPAVGDQRFGLRQFKFEIVAQEHRESLLDVFGFDFRSGEPEQHVVGVTDVAEPSVARILRVLARKAPLPSAQRAHLGAVTASFGCSDCLRRPGILGGDHPGRSPGVFRVYRSFSVCRHVSQA